MKHLFLLLQISCLCFALISCGGNKNSNKDSKNTDNIAPIINLPQNTTLTTQVLIGLQKSDLKIQEFLNAAIATDNKDDDVVSSNDAPEIFPIGVTTVTFSHQDSSGNTAKSGQSTLTVIKGEDITPPIITTPTDIFLSTQSPEGLLKTTRVITDFLNSALVTDNFDNTTIANNDAPEKLPLGATTVTFTFTDSAGNVAEEAYAQVIIDQVEDTTRPHITTPEDINLSTQNISGVSFNNHKIKDFLNAAITIDNVDKNNIASNDTPKIFPIGKTKVTFNHEDGSGNQADPVSAFVEITLEDDITPPIIAQPRSFNFEVTNAIGLNKSASQIQLFLNSAIASDNRDAETVAFNDAPDVFPLGPTTVTFTSSDNAKNTASPVIATIDIKQTQIVDTKPPEVIPPADIQFVTQSTEGMTLTNDEIQIFLNAAVAIDNKDPDTIAYNNATDDFPIGTTVVTFWHMDAAGNVSTTSEATVTVTVGEDITAPQISTPQSLTLGTESAFGVDKTDAQIQLFLNSALVTDNIDKNTIAANDSPEIFPVGTTTVTFFHTDMAGNRAQEKTSNIIITIEDDTTAPVITSPNAMTLEAQSPDGIPKSNVQIQAFLNTALVSDNVDLNTIASNDAPDIFPVGNTIVIFSYTDAAGNKAQNKSSIVTIYIGNDNTAPIITVPESLTLDTQFPTGVAKSDSNIQAFLNTAMVTDNIDPAGIANNDAPDLFPIGTTTVTFSYTDSADNKAQNKASKVTITLAEDTTPPVINTPNSVSLETQYPTGIDKTDTQIQSLLSNAVTSDNIDANSIASNDAPEVLPIGQTTITFSYTDKAGNAAQSTTSVVTVSLGRDTTSPVIFNPNNLALETQSPNGTDKSDPQIQAFLNSALVTDNIDENNIADNDAPDTFPLGQTIVTFSYTDVAGNKAQNKRSMVTINLGADNTAPVITVPNTLTLDSQFPTGISKSDVGIQAFLNAAQVTDNIDPDGIANNDAPDIFPLGSTTVTFSYVDSAGNTAVEQTAMVVIVLGTDITAPIITPPNDLSIDTQYPSGIPKSNVQIQTFLNTALATDNIDVNTIASNDSPDVFPTGSTIVTFSYMDAAGNKAQEKTATVTITLEADVTKPIIYVPAKLNLDSQDPGGIAKTNLQIKTFLNSAIARDNIDDDTIANNNAPDIFLIGDTTVTFSHTDSAGNEAADKTSTVTVTTSSDITPPVINAPNNLSIETQFSEGVPQSDPQIKAFLNSAITTDNIDNDSIASNDAPDLFPVGVTSVMFQYTDAAGNNAVNKSASVTINLGVDITSPIITAPMNVTLESQYPSGISKSEPKIQAFLNSAQTTDNVDEESIANNDAPDIFPIGTTTVTFNKTDDAGNIAISQTAMVIVSLGVDITAPVIVVPDNLFIDSQSPIGIAKTDLQIQTFLNKAVVSDNIDADNIASNDAPETLPVGTTLVSFTYIDKAGNSAEVVQASIIITKVDDTTAPTITKPTDLTLTSLNSAGIENSNEQIQTFLNSATTKDNVDADTIAINNAPEVLPIGVTTVTFSHQDDAGNSAVEVTAIITVTNPVEEAFVTADTSALSVSEIQTYLDYERNKLINICQTKINDFYPNNDFGEYDFNYRSSGNFYTTTTTLENVPIQMGDNNKFYAWMGQQSNTGRYVFSGYDFLDRALDFTGKDINGDDLSYSGLKEITAKIFIWALGANSDEIFNEELTIVTLNSSTKKDLTKWLEFYPSHKWKINTYEDDSSVYESGDYDLFLEIYTDSNLTNNGVHRKALFTDKKPVIAYSYSPNNPLSEEDMIDFGLVTLERDKPILNQGLPSDICAVYSYEPIIRTIMNLENGLAPIVKTGMCSNRQCDYADIDNAAMPDKTSAYSGYREGVDLLSEHLISLSKRGQDILKSNDYYNIIKGAVLIGDKYREAINYTNENGINRDTHPVEFHKTYFADYSTQLARSSHKRQENLGYYSLGVPASTIAAEPTTTLHLSYSPRPDKPADAKDEWLSSKVYLLPGVPMTVTRTDDSTMYVQLRLNMFRENRPIWGYEQEYYDGPQNIKSDIIDLQANKPYTISSPIGGAVYLNYTYNDDSTPIEITYEGAAQHVVLEPNQDGSLLTTEQAEAFDNEFINSPYAFTDILLQNGVELHIIKYRYLKIMKAENSNTPDSYTAEDVAGWVNSFDTYLINKNYEQYGILADFLPEHSQSVKDFCTKLDNLSDNGPVGIYDLCEDSDIHAIPKKQHINLEWDPRCGSSCAGNPLDSKETITIRQGYVISHELGHNLQTTRTKIYNKKSTEISTNIYPYRSLSSYYLAAGIEAVDYSRASVDFKSAYTLLQYYHKNGISDEEHPWLTDEEVLKINDVTHQFEEFRRAFYMQFFFIHNSWDIFTKITIIDRIISETSTDDWALYNSNLGFSTYIKDELNSMTGEDFMAIALSLATDLDHTDYFAAWGVTVSDKAQDQIKANQELVGVKLLSLPLELYKVPDAIIDGKIVESPIYGDMFNRVIKDENIRKIDGESTWENGESNN